VPQVGDIQEQELRLVPADILELELLQVLEDILEVLGLREVILGLELQEVDILELVPHQVILGLGLQEVDTPELEHLEAATLVQVPHHQVNLEVLQWPRWTPRFSSGSKQLTKITVAKLMLKNLVWLWPMGT